LFYFFVRKDKPLRAIVMDVYMEGKNVTCKCRVVQGVVQTGDVIVLLPIGDEAAVARIDHFVSQEHNFLAMAGDTVNVILSGIDVARVMTGCVLSHAPLALRPPVKRKMQAKILVMEQLQVPIIRGAQVLFHMHSIDVPAVISKLVATTKRDGAVDKMKPRVIRGGTNATVEITLQEKVCLETFADCRALGRFVLRRGGDSIAVGIIEAVL
jgi:elongation factor 1 alpha-like protein